MWGLSAYFARIRMQRQVVTTTPQVAKYIVSEAATGEYQLNTTTGNRSGAAANQRSVGNRSQAIPSLGAASGGRRHQPGENRRQALARQITGDIQFSRAIVNYVWEKFMVRGVRLAVEHLRSCAPGSE